MLLGHKLDSKQTPLCLDLDSPTNHCSLPWIGARMRLRLQRGLQRGDRLGCPILTGSIPVSATNSSNTYGRQGITGYHAQGARVALRQLAMDDLTHETPLTTWFCMNTGAQLSPSGPSTVHNRPRA